MDGVLARANCLLITTLWTVFKFVMVPLGARLAARLLAGEFAVVFALIWGSYIVTDASSEIGGSLFGKQTLRVWGIGDVNRKSIGGTVSGFVAALVFCLWIVLGHGLPAPWIGLAIVIAVSNTLLELFSPQRHRRFHDGDHQRADLLGVRRVRPVTTFAVNRRGARQADRRGPPAAPDPASPPATSSVSSAATPPAPADPAAGTSTGTPKRTAM